MSRYLATYSITGSGSQPCVSVSAADLPLGKIKQRHHRRALAPLGILRDVPIAAVFSCFPASTQSRPQRARSSGVSGAGVRSAIILRIHRAGG